MKGIYFLILKLDEPTKNRIGALGEIQFQDGRYIYVGSAQNGLEGRISRHLGSEKSKHWHIDYLLESAEIEEVLAFEMDKEKECESAKVLGDIFDRVENFGCTDCDCDSHLFFTQKSLDGLIQKITAEIGREGIESKDLELQ